MPEKTIIYRISSFDAFKEEFDGIKQNLFEQFPQQKKFLSKDAVTFYKNDNDCKYSILISKSIFLIKRRGAENPSNNNNNMNDNLTLSDYHIYVCEPMGYKSNVYRTLYRMSYKNNTLNRIGEKTNYQEKMLKELDVNELDIDAVFNEKEFNDLVKIHNKPLKPFTLLENGNRVLTQPLYDIPDGDVFIKNCSIKNYSTAQLINAFLELCASIKILHDNKVIHSDIKPANILISSIPCKIKLVDFGFAHKIIEQRACGTPLFSAPEQKNNLCPTIASEMYTLGLTLLNILFGKKIVVSRDNCQIEKNYTYEDLVQTACVIPPDLDWIEDSYYDNFNEQEKTLYDCLKKLIKEAPEERPNIDAFMQELNSILSIENTKVAGFQGMQTGAKANPNIQSDKNTWSWLSDSYHWIDQSKNNKPQKNIWKTLFCCFYKPVTSSVIESNDITPGDDFSVKITPF